MAWNMIAIIFANEAVQIWYPSAWERCASLKIALKLILQKCWDSEASLTESSVKTKASNMELLIKNTWFPPTLLTPYTGSRSDSCIKLTRESSDSTAWHFIKNFNENKLSRIATGEIWRTQSLYLLNYFIDFPCPHGCRLIHPSLICRIDFLRSVISLWITSPHRG